jgi:hypothetical protein
MRDLVVLIAGILLALAGDAWWEQRQEAAVEIGYLESIRDDLAQMSLELDRAIVSDSADAAMNFQEVQRLRAGEPVGRLSFRFEDVSFSIGTIQALVGSGDIRLVSSRELRADIIAFHATFDARLAWSRALEAQIIENLRESVRAGEAERAARDSPLPEGAARSSDYIATVLSHALILGNRTALHRRVRQAADRLSEAISRELQARTTD